MKAILIAGDCLTQQDPVACGTRITANGWMPTGALLLLWLECVWQGAGAGDQKQAAQAPPARLQSAEVPLEPAGKAGERLGPTGLP